MAVFVPDDPAALLLRDRCAAALTEAGYPTSPATLATKATRGGGPPFRKYGPRVLYEWRSTLAWAQSRLGPVVNSTSELDRSQTHSGQATGRDPALATANRDLAKQPDRNSIGAAADRPTPKAAP